MSINSQPSNTSRKMFPILLSILTLLPNSHVVATVNFPVCALTTHKCHKHVHPSYPTSHPHAQGSVYMYSHHGEGGGGEDLQLVGGCTSGEHLLPLYLFAEPSSVEKDLPHHAPDPLDLWQIKHINFVLITVWHKTGAGYCMIHTIML